MHCVMQHMLHSYVLVPAGINGQSSSKVGVINVYELHEVASGTDPKFDLKSDSDTGR
jgi:hypothetical protein